MDTGAMLKTVNKQAQKNDTSKEELTNLSNCLINTGLRK
jgi:hypothetical protein